MTPAAGHGLSGSSLTPFTTAASSSMQPDWPSRAHEEFLLPAANGECIVDAAEHYEQTMIEGAFRHTVVMLSRPSQDYMDEFCCGLTNRGFHYTVVDYGPSDIDGMNNYICSVWVQEDPNVPVSFVPGNETTSAGLKIGIPPADPECEARNTFGECSNAALGSQAECVWWAGACHYEPPIDCQGVASGPFCIGIAVAEEPFPGGGEPGAILNTFNWTSGTITGDLDVVVYPQQLVELGDSSWWSVGNDPVGWNVCVTYNELWWDGGSSDPNSGFSACVNYNTVFLGISAGMTDKIDYYQSFGVHTGWTSDGFDWDRAGIMWAQFIFWGAEKDAAANSLLA